ncbi:MAG TPA: acyl-CoA dehydrogenase family protein [Burkholderiales bacterium]|nr:acyl-CoA dehydrogenase family protein [Burkholderiales bacterium]
MWSVPDSLLELVRTSSLEAEGARRLPERVHRAMLDAGIYRLYVPKRYGGQQADYWRGAEIAFELARASGSTGWVASVIASHAWVQGMMALEAQDEVWKATPRAVIASASWGPASSVKPGNGGFVLDGTWRFASGVDYADWAHFNLFLPSGHRFALVPRRDFTIIDD